MRALYSLFWTKQGTSKPRPGKELPLSILPPLHLACVSGAADALEALLARGANIQATSGLPCWTPLHSATASGNHRVANILVDRGADPCARDYHGLTPIELAEDSRTRAILKEAAAKWTE